jgi:succinate dehydrogenase/fumarate reductase flavoprotein subunit
MTNGKRKEAFMSSYEVDVLVVGFGAAGANAAIAAHDAGARVLILEKLRTPGGNSAVCAGAMLVPENLEAAISYYRALASGTVDEETIRAFAEAMVRIPELLSSFGLEYKWEPSAPPTFPTLMTERLKQIHIKPTGAEGFRFLEALVRERGIEVLTEVRVTSLIQDPKTREILGATAQHNGEELIVSASKAVVLTCGGYGSNPAMLAQFNIPGATDFIFPYGSPGNTGDGIALATQAGAALWHMASLEWGRLCAREPSRKFGTAIGYGLGLTKRAGGFLIANRYGERFMAEDTSLSHCKTQPDLLRYDHKNAEYRNLPAYLLCDQSYRLRGPLATTAQMTRKKRGGVVGYATVNKIYDWSLDNQAEIDAGWVIQAATISELGHKIGVDPIALEETIQQYNLACANQCDSLFGRDKMTLVPFERSPYFAVEVGLALVNTQGGPKRNGKCQVLDHNNGVIPRLYAAGEVSSFFGFLYQVGSNYPEAWASGRIAGLEAARLKPAHQRSEREPSSDGRQVVLT